MTSKIFQEKTTTAQKRADDIALQTYFDPSSDPRLVFPSMDAGRYDKNVRNLPPPNRGKRY